MAQRNKKFSSLLSRLQPAEAAPLKNEVPPGEEGEEPPTPVLRTGTSDGSKDNPDSRPSTSGSRPGTGTGGGGGGSGGLNAALNEKDAESSTPSRQKRAASNVSFTPEPQLGSPRREATMGSVQKSTTGAELKQMKSKLGGMMKAAMSGMSDLVQKRRHMVWAKHPTTSKLMPSARSGALAVAVRGQILIFGGMREFRVDANMRTAVNNDEKAKAEAEVQRQYLNDLYRYDIESGVWEIVHKSVIGAKIDQFDETFGDIPIGRAGHAGTSVEGRMVVVFGGWRSDYGKMRYLNDLYELDLSTMIWSRPKVSGEIPSARTYAQMVEGRGELLRGRVIMFGGNSGYWGKDYNATLYVYDVDYKQWSTPKVAGDFPSGRAQHRMGTMKDGRIFLFGGSNKVRGKPNYLYDFFVLDAIAMEWQRMKVTGEAPPALSGHGAVEVEGGIFLYGGATLKQSGAVDFNEELFLLDMERKEWRKLPNQGDPPPPRAAFCMVSYNDAIHTLYGFAVDEGVKEQMRDHYVFDAGGWRKSIDMLLKLRNKLDNTKLKDKIKKQEEDRKRRIQDRRRRTLMDFRKAQKAIKLSRTLHDRYERRLIIDDLQSEDNYLTQRNLLDGLLEALRQSIRKSGELDKIVSVMRLEKQTKRLCQNIDVPNIGVGEQREYVPPEVPSEGATEEGSQKEGEGEEGKGGGATDQSKVKGMLGMLNSGEKEAEKKKKEKEKKNALAAAAPVDIAGRVEIIAEHAIFVLSNLNAEKAKGYKNTLARMVHSQKGLFKEDFTIEDEKEGGKKAVSLFKGAGATMTGASPKEGGMTSRLLAKLGPSATQQRNSFDASSLGKGAKGDLEDTSRTFTEGGDGQARRGTVAIGAGAGSARNERKLSLLDKLTARRPSEAKVVVTPRSGTSALGSVVEEGVEEEEEEGEAVGMAFAQMRKNRRKARQADLTAEVEDLAEEEMIEEGEKSESNAGAGGGMKKTVLMRSSAAVEGSGRGSKKVSFSVAADGEGGGGSEGEKKGELTEAEIMAAAAKVHLAAMGDDGGSRPTTSESSRGGEGKSEKTATTDSSEKEGEAVAKVEPVVKEGGKSEGGEEGGETAASSPTPSSPLSPTPAEKGMSFKDLLLRKKEAKRRQNMPSEEEVRKQKEKEEKEREERERQAEAERRREEERKRQEEEEERKKKEMEDAKKAREEALRKEREEEERRKKLMEVPAGNRAKVATTMMAKLNINNVEKSPLYKQAMEEQTSPKKEDEGGESSPSTPAETPKKPVSWKDKYRNFYKSSAKKLSDAPPADEDGDESKKEEEAKPSPIRTASMYVPKGAMKTFVGDSVGYGAKADRDEEAPRTPRSERETSTPKGKSSIALKIMSRLQRGI